MTSIFSRRTGPLFFQKVIPTKVHIICVLHRVPVKKKICWIQLQEQLFIDCFKSWNLLLGHGVFFTPRQNLTRFYMRQGWDHYLPYKLRFSHSMFFLLVFQRFWTLNLAKTPELHRSAKNPRNKFSVVRTFLLLKTNIKYFFLSCQDFPKFYDKGLRFNRINCSLVVFMKKLTNKFIFLHTWSVSQGILFTLIYNFKLKLRSLQKKAQKNSIVMTKGVYDTDLHFSTFF